MPKPQGPAHTDPKDLQSHLRRSLGQSKVAFSGFIIISFAFRGGLENQEFLYQECLLRIYHVKRTPEVNELRAHSPQGKGDPSPGIAKTNCQGIIYQQEELLKPMGRQHCSIAVEV